MLFDNKTSQFSSSVSSVTKSLTVGVNSNRLLILAENHSNNPVLNVTSVTYAGIAMIKFLTSTIIGTNQKTMWYLLAPATGVNNIVVTYASAITNSYVFAGSFYDANQSDPLIALTTKTATGTGIFQIVNDLNAGLVIDFLEVLESETQVPNHTLLDTIDNGFDRESYGVSYVLGTGRQTMSWTWGVSDDTTQFVAIFRDLQSTQVLPTQSNIKTMDYIARGLPHINTPANASINTGTMDYISRGLPLVTNPFGGLTLRLLASTGVGK
jgi:hypothetical protein